MTESPPQSIPEQNPRRVVDVGNCPPDHAAVRRLLTQNFQCEIVQCHGPDDTLAELRSGRAALVLINRKLDRDYSDGVEIVRQIKADPQLAAIPVMLVTNYDQLQKEAVGLGAEPGFGKLQFDEPGTQEKLAQFLTPIVR